MQGRDSKKARVEQLLNSPSGRFRITTAHIGEGSTGKVLLGEDTQNSCQYAVKVVNKNQRWLKEDAMKEVAVLGKLKHENIIRVESFEEDDNYLYLFMEYLEERDIYTYMQKNGKFSEESAFYLFKQMVAAVEACHNQFVCHHDIKLENFVLNKNMDVKLIDFAYAVEFKLNGSNNYLTKYNGSPAYSAPEILFRQPHTESVDMFGLGTCLYYMLCQCFPFCDEDSTTFEELCLNVKAFNLEFPEGLSNEVRDLISHLLAKQKRYSFQQIREHPWWLANHNTDRINDAVFEEPLIM